MHGLWLVACIFDLFMIHLLMTDDRWWVGSDDGGWDDDEKGNGDGDLVLEAVGDDDTSWKVRIAAVKMLTSFIQTHKGTVEQYHLKMLELC